jgi:hypothetical protein
MKKASKTLKANSKFLKLLPRFVEKYGKSRICQEISCCQMKCLREIFHNLNVGNIPISQSDKKGLKKHKKYLKVLASKKSSYKLKKKILTQKGDGIIPILVSTILPMVIDFIAMSAR